MRVLHVVKLSILPESGIPADVVAAVDVNTIANEVYRHNFPNIPLWSKTIEVRSPRRYFTTCCHKGERRRAKIMSP